MSKKIAYIIPFRQSDKYRLNNLIYIIKYTLYNFKYLQIYIVEQDKNKKLQNNEYINKLITLNKIKYFFIKSNNNDIDRGHMFNCTIKYALGKEETIIMGDGDIPLLENIPKMLYLIHNKTYYFISPYTYLSKLNNKNSILLKTEKKYKFKKGSGMYTISGGILIVNRSIFEKMGMWYEFNSYGNEDRSLDVIMEYYYKKKVFRHNFTYVHIWHPSSKSKKSKLVKKNSLFRLKYFGCKCGKEKDLYPHIRCNHNTKWIKYYNKQKKGNLNKYKIKNNTTTNNNKIKNNITTNNNNITTNNHKIKLLNNTCIYCSIINNKKITHYGYNEYIYKYLYDVQYCTNKNDLYKYKNIIINGGTINILNNLYKLFLHNNLICTLFLIKNQTEIEYLKLFLKYNKKIYTDNIFTYNKLKHIIPIMNHPSPLIIIQNQKNNNIKNTIFIDLRRTFKKNNKYITNLKKIDSYEILKFRINDKKQVINDYDNVFQKSKILVYVDDNFNIYRTSKKIIDSVIQNKFIILQKNKNKWSNIFLKSIKYPNYLEFDNYEKLQKTLTQAVKTTLKDFDINKIQKKHAIIFYKDDIVKNKNIIKYYKNFIKMQSKKIIIMGNGPSSKNININELKDFTVIGMNSAYRFWYTKDWFPDIYCCLDIALMESHFEEIVKLIINKKCKLFFLRDFFKKLCKRKNINIDLTNIYFLENMNNLLFKNTRHITTGSYSVKFAMYLKYTDIRLIGIDSNYVNFVPNCKKEKEKNRLSIIKEHKSINYFFDDYQKIGDVYNIPNPDKEFICKCSYCKGKKVNHKNLHNMVFDHIEQDIKNIKQYKNVKITNYSSISKIKNFPFKNIKNITK